MNCSKYRWNTFFLESLNIKIKIFFLDFATNFQKFWKIFKNAYFLQWIETSNWKIPIKSIKLSINLLLNSHLPFVCNYFAVAVQIAKIDFYPFRPRKTRIATSLSILAIPIFEASFNKYSRKYKVFFATI